ncbi:MAG TPA: hypothetical protein VNK82_10815 [Terriglobales bacterium]|nr:hypothetical protein [Terriglobales bacterium]
MADYIYTMETRLTPDQQRAAGLVQQAARAHEMNVYLTGGAVRDLISGFTIRDLDFTVQGNALRLQRDLEKAGAVIERADEELRSLLVLLPGNVRAEIAMARSEKYEKPGKPPEVAAATIVEDLRRRDFTVNAIALSLNEGSRGLLLDPANGVADIEAKLLRILHNYSFLEEPSRLIRATRFAARFHWTLEERTQARYDAAKENQYIENILPRAIGQEIEQLAYEENPLVILRALEKEGWLKVLSPHWTVGKADADSLAQMQKTRELMAQHGYAPDASAATIYFLTRRLESREISAMQKLIPRRTLVEKWNHLEEDAKELAARLSGKEAATPSKTWKLLSEAPPETILFLEVTARAQSVRQKIRNFFGKWRQLKQRLPFPEMAEMHITPALPQYAQLTEEAFHLLLDGRLRSHGEIVRFLKPYAPPPPPPPPPPTKKRKKGEPVPAKPAPAKAAPPAAKKPGEKEKGKQPVHSQPAAKKTKTNKAVHKPARQKAAKQKPARKKKKR